MGTIKQLVRASLRNAGWYRIRLRSKTDVVVISTGGVATTMLIEHLGKYLSVNCPGDTDHLKHLPRLPNRFPSDVKVLFIYGELEDIVVSIDRRRWIAAHGSKLGSIASVVGFESARRQALRRAVERQIAWYRSQRLPNLLTIDYAQLWDRLDEIAEFLGISKTSFVQEFPARRSRTGREV